MEQEEIQSVARDVAEKLGENEPNPVRQIEMILKHLGPEFVQEHLDETLKIEAEGGMMTQDGKRRRSAGGVFFYIVKGKMEPSIRQIIFPNFGQTTKGAVMEWRERQEMIDKVKDDPGELRRVAVTLYGRPGKIEILDNSVVMAMNFEHPTAPYPRGVPHPPGGTNPFVVYMAMKQWEVIAEHVKSGKDELIVEGTLSLDQETGTIAVYATRITTKMLEKRQRKDEEQQARAATKAANEAKAQADKEKARQTRSGDRNGSRGARDDRGARPGKPGGRPGGRPDRPRAASGPRSNPIPERPAIDTGGMPPDIAQQLRKLEQASQTLRSRIAAKEAKGQKASMEQKLLRNNEQQIEKLLRENQR